MFEVVLYNRCWLLYKYYNITSFISNKYNLDDTKRKVSWILTNMKKQITKKKMRINKNHKTKKQKCKFTSNIL